MRVLIAPDKFAGTLTAVEAAHAIARQTEGSVRDALSLLDQASVLGAGEIGEDVVTSLIGSGRSDVQYALGDAVAVGGHRQVGWEHLDRHAVAARRARRGLEAAPVAGDDHQVTAVGGQAFDERGADTGRGSGDQSSGHKYRPYGGA